MSDNTDLYFDDSGVGSDLGSNQTLIDDPDVYARAIEWANQTDNDSREILGFTQSGTPVYAPDLSGGTDAPTDVGTAYTGGAGGGADFDWGNVARALGIKTSSLPDLLNSVAALGGSVRGLKNMFDPADPPTLAGDTLARDKFEYQKQQDASAARAGALNQLSGLSENQVMLNFLGGKRSLINQYAGLGAPTLMSRESIDDYTQQMSPYASQMAVQAFGENDPRANSFMENWKPYEPPKAAVSSFADMIKSGNYAGAHDLTKQYGYGDIGSISGYASEVSGYDPTAQTQAQGAFSPTQATEWIQAQSPLSLPVKRAQGGGIEGYAKGSTPKFFDGGTKGQDDKVPALLSDGEFVFDADTVAALGDGNTKAGASALEQMRQNIRKHKRAAPKNKIPPKAKKPEAYLPKKGAK